MAVYIDSNENTPYTPENIHEGKEKKLHKESLKYVNSLNGPICFVE